MDLWWRLLIFKTLAYICYHLRSCACRLVPGSGLHHQPIISTFSIFVWSCVKKKQITPRFSFDQIFSSSSWSSSSPPTNYWKMKNEKNKKNRNIKGRKQIGFEIGRRVETHRYCFPRRLKARLVKRTQHVNRLSFLINGRLARYFWPSTPVTHDVRDEELARLLDRYKRERANYLCVCLCVWTRVYTTAAAVEKRDEM